MPLSKFKAVFFDVGGTLIRVHPSVGDVYATHARDFGFSGTPDELNEEFHSQWKKMGGIESLGNQSGPEAEEKFWKDLVFEVFQPLGGLKRFDEYFELIFEVFRDGSNWKIHEDVIESRIFEKSRISKKTSKICIRSMSLTSRYLWIYSIILHNFSTKKYFIYVR